MLVLTSRAVRQEAPGLHRPLGDVIKRQQQVPVRRQVPVHYDVSSARKAETVQKAGTWPVSATPCPYIKHYTERP